MINKIVEEMEQELQDIIQYKVQRKKRTPNRLYLCEDLDIIEISMDYYQKKIKELEEECLNHILIAELNNRIASLEDKREDEIRQVAKKYTEAFEEYFISIEEISNMLGVNVQYIKMCMKQTDLKTLELHRTIRRWIKRQIISSERWGRYSHSIVGIIEKYKIDYSKKIFVSTSSLYDWLRNHMTTSEGYPLTNDMIYEIMTHRYLVTVEDGRMYPFLCSLKTYKDFRHLKHDCQLYRIAHKTFCMYSEEANKPLARFCIDSDFTQKVIDYESEAEEPLAGV